MAARRSPGDRLFCVGLVAVTVEPIRLTKPPPFDAAEIVFDAAHAQGK